MKKIKGPIWYSVHPPTPSNSAWRPRRVDAELDPGGRGKELVGKGLDTVRARLVTGRARLVIVCATLATVRFKKDIPQTKLAKI